MNCKNCKLTLKIVNSVVMVMASLFKMKAHSRYWLNYYDDVADEFATVKA